jgi:hypothetical protein
VTKTLGWDGDSYAALSNKTGRSGQRASDLSLALSYYRQSRETWAKLTDEELKPYRLKLTLTQSRARQPAVPTLP